MADSEIFLFGDVGAIKVCGYRKTVVMLFGVQPCRSVGIKGEVCPCSVEHRFAEGAKAAVDALANEYYFIRFCKLLRHTLVAVVDAAYFLCHAAQTSCAALYIAVVGDGDMLPCYGQQGGVYIGYYKLHIVTCRKIQYL